MTITLTPEQQERLEAAVAAGQFASVEEAVRWAVDHLVVTDADHDDLSWTKPYLDEARASIARGEGISLEEFNAHVDRRLKRRFGYPTWHKRILMRSSSISLVLPVTTSLRTTPRGSARPSTCSGTSRESARLVRRLDPKRESWSVAPYAIFYDGEPTSANVHVLRILHSRRDITPKLIAHGRLPSDR